MSNNTLCLLVHVPILYANEHSPLLGQELVDISVRYWFLDESKFKQLPLRVFIAHMGI